MPNGKTVIVVMGVSGSGKTEIGKLLSQKLSRPFYDGDDFHPEANIKKMSSGNPLNDDDRKEWLIQLNKLAVKHRDKGAIIACSALKKNYRSILRAGMGDNMAFVYLNGSFKLIQSRLNKRKGHFMSAQLLQSQFDTLEPPSKAITVSIEHPPKKIVEEIVKKLRF
ncbi:gluconokinase [Flagellimonas halotolerans]|uniref:Gluconokinase n=1 Tax=Flagellimonas halotolerans TaxID=3112164 RepID=A0ABU6IV56_9FLAO|nr:MULTISPECIES: gluconokinase [unclassified Allomuricauda]MEC3966960.1 gluconokinase [Muricauda sp. SYSU M86414]MEC4266823.1 gluconokinase [Muricauda sp. SYSU M84420]